MNGKKVILINLSKGRLGEENSSFFGSMFLTKIKQAGMSRVKIKPEDREDFYLYVDEFHNVVTDTFENLLTESRKYGLCITIAHQYFGQLSARMQSTALGNSGTIIVFRVGGEDAVKLKPEMAPVFDIKDMINLGVQEFYIKETIDGETYDPFSAETLRIMPAPHPSYRQRILDQSRTKYSITVDDAKRLIAEEEATIIRSAQEKAIIEGKGKVSAAAETASQEKKKETGEPEPLI